MTKRGNISLLTKLASALLQLGHIPYEDAKQMTAENICSLYVFDHHPVRHEDGGPELPWNLTPRLIKAHREKTAKIDAPEAAKGRAIRKAQVAHAERMAQKVTGTKPHPVVWHKRKIASRPFPRSIKER
jgi:hypothetical protein